MFKFNFSQPDKRDDEEQDKSWVDKLLNSTTTKREQQSEDTAESDLRKRLNSLKPEELKRDVFHLCRGVNAVMSGVVVLLETQKSNPDKPIHPAIAAAARSLFKFACEHHLDKVKSLSGG